MLDLLEFRHRFRESFADAAEDFCGAEVVEFEIRDAFLQHRALALGEALGAEFFQRGFFVGEVQFAVGGQSFTVRGRTINRIFDVDDPDLILCRTVLAEVCSEHRIEHVDDHAQIWAVVDHVGT